MLQSRGKGLIKNKNLFVFWRLQEVRADQVGLMRNFGGIDDKNTYIHLIFQ